jgi:hypothetical protein
MLVVAIGALATGADPDGQEHQHGLDYGRRGQVDL